MLNIDTAEGSSSTFVAALPDFVNDRLAGFIRHVK